MIFCFSLEKCIEELWGHPQKVFILEGCWVLHREPRLWILLIVYDPWSQLIKCLTFTRLYQFWLSWQRKQQMPRLTIRGKCIRKKLTFSREIIKRFLFGTLRVWKGNVYGPLVTRCYDWQEKPTCLPPETSCSGTFWRVVNWCWHKHKQIKWVDSALFNSKSPNTKESSKYSSNDQNLYWFLFYISSSKLSFLTGWMSAWMILFEMRIQALNWGLPQI